MEDWAYHDPTFNRLFDVWIEKKKNKWYVPSLDHRQPKTRGGTDDISNLRFVTWFENYTKGPRTEEEWETFKRETNTHSDLF